METTLTVTQEKIQAHIPITVFHLQGWLDASGEETLLAAARDAYSEGARHLVLDLAGVETLTSAGMRAMHKVYKLFTPTEERMKRLHVAISNAPSQVNNILGITGFLLNIPNYRNIQSAVESFK